MLLLLAMIVGALHIEAQQGTNQRDVLTAAEEKQVKAVERAVSKRLQYLQAKAHERVMGRLDASERNRRLACTLGSTGALKEREGTDAGVVSFISATPESDPALLKLVSFPPWSKDGEYSFHHFDVAAWPMRDDAHKGSFAVGVEMRQGFYWDWADSHITDDSLGKDWWRPLVSPKCN